MKTFLASSRITLAFIVLCCILYPLLMLGLAKVSPEQGMGFSVPHPFHQGKSMFTNIGQSFTSDSYFQSRPSAVNYNAAGSCGSNKGPSNPDYLQAVMDRADSILAHNPGLGIQHIPADIVTFSGSGLDPHISVESALLQVTRIAQQRQVSESSILSLVNQHTEGPFLGLLGPTYVNVLSLNISLDANYPVKQ